jgi:hypothetical protein
MTIELRLTEVNPPEEEPHRTIYHDIVNLPDPVIQGITIRYFNFDDVSLYFKITGSGTGYTFTPVSLGLLGSGTSAYANLDNFASRAKPSSAQLPNGEMGENITLTLTAYTDSGYTNLKWTFERIVQVIWINSADAAFTIDYLNNFDDGTIQGWASASELSCYTSLSVRTTYVLTPPYSLRNQMYSTYLQAEGRARTYKSFTTQNKNRVYAIIDIRLTIINGAGVCKYIRFQNGDTVLIHLGRQYDTVMVNYVPVNKWIRVVVPLPVNAALEFRIVTDHYRLGQNFELHQFMDDFKIVSK